jgi:hypothetical protein
VLVGRIGRRVGFGQPTLDRGDADPERLRVEHGFGAG